MPTSCQNAYRKGDGALIQNTDKVLPLQALSLALLVAQTLFSFESHSSQDNWIVEDLELEGWWGDLVWVSSREGRGQRIG